MIEKEKLESIEAVVKKVKDKEDLRPLFTLDDRSLCNKIIMYKEAIDYIRRIIEC